jgi:hypothetical protein
VKARLWAGGNKLNFHCDSADGKVDFGTGRKGAQNYKRVSALPGSPIEGLLRKRFLSSFFPVFCDKASLEAMVARKGKGKRGTRKASQSPSCPLLERASLGAQRGNSRELYRYTDKSSKLCKLVSTFISGTQLEVSKRL